jgi:hypothetical protein
MPSGPPSDDRLRYRRIEREESSWHHLIAQEWQILADLPKWQEEMLRDRRRRPPEAGSVPG